MHVLQSTAWQAFQESLGRQIYRQSGDGWEFLAVLERGRGNSRLYCPYGPTAANVESYQMALQALARLGKKLGATFIRVELTTPTFAKYLRTNNWKKVTYQSLNPEHSHILDLTQPEDALIANMAQPVRNCYRNYQKKGFHVKSSSNPSDITLFINLIHEVAARTGMRPHSDDYFSAQAAALFPTGAAKLWYAVHDDGTPIAAALIYYGDDTAYYAHAAASSNPIYRKLNPGTALLAEAIVDAKHQGKQTFDLYGIAPDDTPSTHPWAGFTKFKRSFGGTDIDYGGSWDLPLHPLAYWAYRTYQSLHK